MVNKNIKYLASYIIPYKRDLVIVFISLISVALSILFIGVVFGKLVDNGISAYRINEVHHSIYLIFFLIVIFAIGSFFRSYFIHLVSIKVVSKLKSDTYNHLLKIGIVQFEHMKIGDIISRFGSDIEAIDSLIISFLSFFLRNFIMLFGAMILMFIQSPKLSLLILTIVPILLVPLLKLSKYIKKLSKMLLLQQGMISSNLEETFVAFRTLYAYNQQEFMSGEFRNKMDSYVKDSNIKLYFRSLFFALAIIMIATTILAVIWIGSTDILKGDMSSGQMISFIYYAIMVGASVGGIAELFSTLQLPFVSLERVVQLNSMKLLLLNGDHLELLSNNYKIKFNNVNFSYPLRPSELILNNISFSIQEGSFTGIVGKSGSGKSTLMQLLLKFYDNYSGQIKLGEQNIKLINDKELRNKISYVDQYPTIFSGTIRSNIAFSNPHASNDQIEKVAEIAGIMEFAKNLELGLNTEVGEKGMRISGGQKQRIAIARALLYQPEILLLDEATSALDNAGEKKILCNIKTFLKGKTIISIAHRITSIEDSDIILVIDQGYLESCGTHEELLIDSKIYSILYKKEKK